MTSISWIRLIHYLVLPNHCKYAVMIYDPLVFASVIGDGLFALFMSAVIVITLISHYVVILILTHIALLNLFYWFGWNFIVGIISESGAFLLHELGIKIDNRYNDEFEIIEFRMYRKNVFINSSMYLILHLFCICMD